MKKQKILLSEMFHDGEPTRKNTKEQVINDISLAKQEIERVLKNKPSFDLRMAISYLDRALKTIAELQ